MTGFVLSLTCCLSLVGAIFGLVGLGRTKQGRHRGRWAAVAAVAVGFSLTLLSAGLLTLGILTDEPIDELQVGECFDAEGLAGEPDDGGVDVSDVQETSCQDPHDAEVLAVDELTREQADDFADDPVDVCSQLLTDRGRDVEDARATGTIVPILDSVSADAGDLLVCALTPDDAGSQFEEPYDPDE